MKLSTMKYHFLKSICFATLAALPVWSGHAQPSLSVPDLIGNWVLVGETNWLYGQEVFVDSSMLCGSTIEFLPEDRYTRIHHYDSQSGCSLSVDKGRWIKDDHTLFMMSDSLNGNQVVHFDPTTNDAVSHVLHDMFAKEIIYLDGDSLVFKTWFLDSYSVFYYSRRQAKRG